MKHLVDRRLGSILSTLKTMVGAGPSWCGQDMEAPNALTESMIDHVDCEECLGKFRDFHQHYVTNAQARLDALRKVS